MARPHHSPRNGTSHWAKWEEQCPMPHCKQTVKSWLLPRTVCPACLGCSAPCCLFLIFVFGVMPGCAQGSITPGGHMWGPRECWGLNSGQLLAGAAPCFCVWLSPSVHQGQMKSGVIPPHEKGKRMDRDGFCLWANLRQACWRPGREAQGNLDGSRPGVQGRRQTLHSYWQDTSYV